jgi:hypothetical protein
MNMYNSYHQENNGARTIGLNSEYLFSWNRFIVQMDLVFVRYSATANMLTASNLILVVQ